MNRIQLEHIIRAASEISDDPEIIVIGSQAIHAQTMRLPPIAFHSIEADVYPRNHPERADEIDVAIGELSPFHATHGYYAHGISPKTAILPAGWEQRLIRINTLNTGGATGLCIDVHDLALSKYAAGREQDFEFNRELVRHGIVSKRRLTRLVPSMPIEEERSRRDVVTVTLADRFARSTFDLFAIVKEIGTRVSGLNHWPRRDCTSAIAPSSARNSRKNHCGGG